MKRFEYLDGLRGLASFSVVMYHSNLWLDFIKDPHFNHPYPGYLLHILFNGHTAVSLFFVLSGLVLSYGYLQKKTSFLTGVEYCNYVIKRIFRIYPAFLVSLMVVFFYDGGSWEKLLHEAALLLPARSAETHFIPPDWTLRIELLISLLIPFLVFIAAFSEILVIVLAGLLFILFGAPVYIFHFTAGILIAKNYDRIANFDFRASRWYSYRYLLVLLMVFCCSFEYIIPLVSGYEFDVNNVPGESRLVYAVNGLGAVMLLVTVIHTAYLQRILETKLLQWLGKISYSLYVIHFFIFFSVLEPWFELFAAKLGSFYVAHFVVRVVLGIVFSLIASVILYYLVEVPGISMGKWVARRFQAPGKTYTKSPVAEKVEN